MSLIWPVVVHNCTLFSYMYMVFNQVINIAGKVYKFASYHVPIKDSNETGLIARRLRVFSGRNIKLLFSLTQAHF